MAYAPKNDHSRGALMRLICYGLTPSRVPLYLALPAMLLQLTTPAYGQAAAPGTASMVNPLIGTGRGPGDTENLFPGPTAPFGMVQLSPDTESKGLGYHYYQDEILDFSMTHMSGVGCSNEGEVPVMPTTGTVATNAVDFSSPYDHKQETAQPGYYQVELPRWGVNAELTATEHTGTLQFTFPAGKAANILLPIGHTLNSTEGATVQLVGDHEMKGSVTNQAFCGAKAAYTVYFDAVFSKPFATSGTWSGASDSDSASADPGSKSVSWTKAMPWMGAYASWPAEEKKRTVSVRIGISYVDAAGAAKNLHAEAERRSFSQLRSEAQDAWNHQLDLIDVDGGSATNRTVFYTALYHSLMLPSVASDVDGRYMGFDKAVHTLPKGHELYANWSGWDIYRTQFPLIAMIDPARTQDLAQSVVLMDQQGGWIGRWPQINAYTNVMAGSPLTIAVATAWLDGLHGFNMNAAYAGMKKDATLAPPKGSPYEGEVGMQYINTLHYVPDDRVKYGSVSQIQEDSIAYASLYYLAKQLGKTQDAAMFHDRALYYRNVFDPAEKFFRPKNADGKWVTPFDPTLQDHGFIEGSGWQYQWLEPSDLSWVVNAMGKAEFNERLTQFFNYSTPGWYGEYYNPYNETDLQAPFEFNWSGQPWKAQAAVRRVLRENYPNTPDGIPGNDDAGEMSAWAVMSMMGMYPVDPASRAYVLVSPLFPKITVHLSQPYSGKSFTIATTASPEQTPYIQSTELNGKPLTKNWIDFAKIADGGTLQFTLAAQPNKSWGSAPADAPPSLSDPTP